MREQDDRGRIAKAEQKAEQKKETEAVIGLYENGVPVSIIAKSLKITEDKATEIIENHKNKA